MTDEEILNLWKKGWNVGKIKMTNQEEKNTTE